MAGVRLMSDLHLEIGPLQLEPAGEDVLVLAGDISVFTDAIAWADEQAKRLGVPVVMVAGNHEFYRNREHRSHTIVHTYAALADHAARLTGGRVKFLQNDATVVAGVRFVGATLWTDFDLLGDPAAAGADAAYGMNDYRRVYYDDESVFRPDIAMREHATSLAFIEHALAEAFAGPTMVVTHHAPSRRSIAGRYADAAVAPAYASNLDRLVERTGATVWQHGHIHHSFDYRIGKTRVIANPRGYYADELNPSFDANLVIDVGPA
jgi:DNA repair exonuclease SbcCD nuclease subunit